MKTTVEIGKTYALRSEAGGEVTDVDGKTLETLEPNKQVHMTAQESEWGVPDDCKVTKVNFKQALAALGLLGGGEKLPAGYTRIEFLESTGAQRVEVGYPCDGRTAWRLKTENTVARSASFPYASTLDGKNRLAVAIANGYWRFDYAAATQSTRIPATLNTVYELELNKNRQCVINGTVVHSFSSVDFNAAPYATLFAADRGDYPFTGRIWFFRAEKDGAEKLELIPAIAPSGRPCMFDTVTRMQFYNSGTGQFIAGVQHAAQLRTVLRKLPDRTGQDMGTLTLSIPAEAYTPEMQELLDTTKALKNWELPIQERAATAATYSLRRVRKVVWVRRVPTENGSYVDADGERWQAEWCSAIYSPRGNDPNLHGYEPFDSVEQAADVWGLVPYTEPEMEAIAD